MGTYEVSIYAYGLWIEIHVLTTLLFSHTRHRSTTMTIAPRADHIAIGFSSSSDAGWILAAAFFLPRM
jgi:hypothetical protein